MTSTPLAAAAYVAHAAREVYEERIHDQATAAENLRYAQRNYDRAVAETEAAKLTWQRAAEAE